MIKTEEGAGKFVSKHQLRIVIRYCPWSRDLVIYKQTTFLSFVDIGVFPPTHANVTFPLSAQWLVTVNHETTNYHLRLPNMDTVMNKPMKTLPNGRVLPGKPHESDLCCSLDKNANLTCCDSLVRTLLCRTALNIKSFNFAAVSYLDFQPTTNTLDLIWRFISIELCYIL